VPCFTGTVILIFDFLTRRPAEIALPLFQSAWTAIWPITQCHFNCLKILNNSGWHSFCNVSSRVNNRRPAKKQKQAAVKEKSQGGELWTI